MTLDALLVAQLGPNVSLNARTFILMFSVLAALLVAYFVGRTLRRQPESTVHPAIVQTFNQRVAAWLIMFCILFAALIPQGRVAYICTIVLFVFVSSCGSREFIPMTMSTSGAAY